MNIRALIFALIACQDPAEKMKLLAQIELALANQEAAQQPPATSAPDSAEIDALRARISELEKINGESDNALETIYAELKAAEAKIAELEGANAAKIAELEAAKATNAAKDAIIATQITELASLRNDVTAALAAKAPTAPAVATPEPAASVAAPEPAAAAAAVEPAPEGMLSTNLEEAPRPAAPSVPIGENGKRPSRHTLAAAAGLTSPEEAPKPKAWLNIAMAPGEFKEPAAAPPTPASASPHDNFFELAKNGNKDALTKLAKALSWVIKKDEHNTCIHKHYVFAGKVVFNLTDIMFKGKIFFTWNRGLAIPTENTKSILNEILNSEDYSEAREVFNTFVATQEKVYWPDRVRA